MDGAIDGAIEAAAEGATDGAAGPAELAGAPGPVQAATANKTTANISGRALARRSWFMSGDTSCLERRFSGAYVRVPSSTRGGSGRLRAAGCG